MSNPDPLAEARERLAQLEHEYQEAQTRSVALAGKLLRVQDQLWRLTMNGRPRPSAYTIGACASCYKTLAFSATDWFLTCSCAYRNLHPQRHGELTANRWKLVFYQSTDEGAGTWRWSLRYFTARDETPPEGSVRVKLWSEQQGWLFLYGASHPRDEDHAAGEHTHTWAGTIAESAPALEHLATRVFVEPWYGAY